MRVSPESRLFHPLVLALWVVICLIELSFPRYKAIPTSVFELSVELFALICVVFFFRDSRAQTLRYAFIVTFLCLTIADATFIYHYYLLGAGFPTPWISFLTEFNYAVMDLSIAVVFVLSFREGFRKTVFKWPNLVPLLPSLPVMIRFGLPLFSETSLSQGPSFVVSETLAILSTLIVFNLATVTYIGARQRSWTWLSAGCLVMILGGWAMRVEKFMGHPLVFGVYEFLWAAGVALLGGTVIFQKKWEGIDSYRAKSLLCQIKLATLVLAFVSIGIIFALQSEAVVRIRFLTLATMAGIFFSAWFSHFVADRIDKFTVTLAETLLRDPDADVRERVRLSEVPIELEEAFNKTIQARLSDYAQARTLQEEMRLSEMRLQMADQVFHDLKSPLCALEMAGELSKKLPEEERTLIRHAIDRIRDIARNLPQSLARTRTAGMQSEAPEDSVHSISHLVTAVVSEKRLQLGNSDVSLEYHRLPSDYGLFVHINGVEVSRVLSNIIGNALQAVGQKGAVEVHVKLAGEHVEILIRDTGHGIARDYLKKVFERGFSKGKAGSGLGLYHAKSVVEHYEGSIWIESELGRGTEVTVRLKKHPPPPWYVPELQALSGSSVVIVDDDPTIHEVWKKRFRDTELTLVHFASPEKALEWQRRELPEAALFLLDYEFLNSNLSGTDVYRALKGERRILVTSRFESVTTLDETDPLFVVPKDQVPIVPIRVV